MKFIMKRQVLVNALANVSRAVSLKNPIPALSGIKFDLKEDRLILTGSNSDITIQTEITDQIDIVEPGGTVLNSRYIFEIIRKIDSEEVTFTKNDSNITTIDGNTSHFELNGSHIEDYPHIDLSKKGMMVKIASKVLKETIEQTAFATSDKETRAALTGVNFRAEDQVLTCLATDSFRMARKTLDLEEFTNFNIIIPKKSLVEISRIIDKDEEITFYVEDKKVLFEINDYLLQTRLIDGKYPNTARLMPDSSDRVMSINAASLVGAIERVSLLSDADKNIIKFALSEDLVTLSSYSQEIGSVEEQLPRAFFKGDDMEISFSARFMLDAIRALNSETVKILFTGAMRPIIIKDIEKDDNIQVVLPVRTY